MASNSNWKWPFGAEGPQSASGDVLAYKEHRGPNGCPGRDTVDRRSNRRLIASGLLLLRLLLRGLLLRLLCLRHEYLLRPVTGGWRRRVVVGKLPREPACNRQSTACGTQTPNYLWRTDRFDIEPALHRRSRFPAGFPSKHAVVTRAASHPNARPGQSPGPRRDDATYFFFAAFFAFEAVSAFDLRFTSAPCARL